jgi:lysophospholipase L1-like esterase
MRRTFLGLAFLVGCVLAACNQSPPAPAPVSPAEPVSSAASASATSAAPVASPAPASAAPSVPRASSTALDLSGVKVVLHVGDSEVGYAAGLSKEMRAKFEARGIEYHDDAWTSARLETVLSEKKLEKLVKAYKPDLLLLNLGTNNLAYPNAKALAPAAAKVAARVASLVPRCVWIGPPHLPPAEKTEGAVVEVLAANASPCRFVDSQAFELSYQPDNIHPDGRGAARWANNLWEILVDGRDPPSGPFRKK